MERIRISGRELPNRGSLAHFGGSFLALLVGPGSAPLAGSAGAAVMILRIAIHSGAKLGLGRSFGPVAADRGVKRRGLYTFVRHPMYAGYMLTHLGFLLIAPSWWNLAVYAGVWGLLVARIFAKERILGTNPGYRDYSAGVRYRLMPGVF